MQVAWGQDTIAVEKDEELALTVLSTEITRRPGTAVLLRIVAELQLAGILVHDSLAGAAGTVLHDDDLHILERLLRKALEQLIHLFRTVIYGNYD